VSGATRWKDGGEAPLDFEGLANAGRTTRHIPLTDRRIGVPTLSLIVPSDDWIVPARQARLGVGTVFTQKLGDELTSCIAPKGPGRRRHSGDAGASSSAPSRCRPPSARTRSRASRCGPTRFWPTEAAHGSVAVSR
jgi:hypothetical protein